MAILRRRDTCSENSSYKQEKYFYSSDVRHEIAEICYNLEDTHILVNDWCQVVRVIRPGKGGLFGIAKAMVLSHHLYEPL